ncbi:MAG: YraN family protein [Bacteroidales bacterium]|nr:YraN family protein [Bacteroidales bacterium]
MADHNELGTLGEQVAAHWLAERGYAILETNYRRGHNEIDIIALHEGMIVVVEVKTRSANHLLPPERAVDHKKRAAIIRLANTYITENGRTEEVRFDIITVVRDGHTQTVEHLPNAFNIATY